MKNLVIFLLLGMSFAGGGVFAQTKFKPKYLREDNKAFRDMIRNASDDGWIEFRRDKPKINPNTFFDKFAKNIRLSYTSRYIPSYNG